MSHIHLPDGILPAWLWISGFVVTAAILVVLTLLFKRQKMVAKLPLLGMFSAVMIIAMSLEIVPLAYHLNLAAVSGIILGPNLGFIAALIANFTLALLGHGGITVLGLNSLTLGIEAVLGFSFFYLFRKVHFSIFWSSFTGTFLALFITTVITLAIIVAGTGQVTKVEFNTKQIINIEILKPATPEPSSLEPIKNLNLATFIPLTLGFGALGWLLESLFSALIISYIYKMKPELFLFKKRKA